ECYQYDECEALRPFTPAGKAVFGVEYEGEPAEFCPVMNELDFDWLFKRLDLDAWRVACR
ncbi:MAG: endo alpha-1,4 polygalactosaminidase, partial [Candidatus Promineifilaceae bacterium]